MVIKVTEQRKNPLLKREEIYCVFEHPDKATPSRKEMLPALEKTLRTRGDLIIIDKIFSVRGRGESKVHAFVYKKKEDIPKEKLEKMQRRMEKKGEPKEEKPAEEPKPEEKGEEAKEEEKPEEKKAEEKPAEPEKKEEEAKEEKTEGKEDG